MRKLALVILLATYSVFSQTPAPKKAARAAQSSSVESPRHLLSYSGFLTEPSSGTPQEIAQSFLRKTAPTLGLSEADLSGLTLARQYRTEHNGVTHLTFRQQFEGVDVYGAAYRVNVDQRGQVLNAGGELMKQPSLPPANIEAGMLAVRSAIRAVNPKLDGSFLAAPGPAGEKFSRFSRGGIADEMEGKPVWYNVRGQLYPAWLFYVPAENGTDLFATIVEAGTQRILQKTNTTKYQQPQPAARGLVFERGTPQPNSTPGVKTEARAQVERTLQPFAGEPVASPRGWVTATETAGNNVVAGTNVGAQRQSPVTASAPDRNFSFPLELGASAPNTTQFANAITTNLFYWANIAHDRFYQIGFDEAAENFQRENFGRGGVGGDPMIANSQYGIAANTQARINNAFYTSRRNFEDGAEGSINMFIFPSNPNRILTDGSLDAEIIVHEYAHGVSGRLVEGGYDSFQGQSMGEAWSDYFGLEFTLPENAPADGLYPVGEYAVQDFGLGIRSRPYTTDMTVNPLTFGNMGRVAGFGPEVHDDGEIFMQALWEGRSALIRQFGDREGRRRMNLLIMDGMKLAPPRPGMVEARDAIILADRVNFKGESQMQLWQAFAKRGFGVLAHSGTPDAVSVSESFAVPSSTASLRFEWDTYSLGEPANVILHDANNTDPSVAIQLTASSGDLESLVLRKKGESYYGTILLGSDGDSTKFDTFLDTVPGDYISAYYVDANTGSGSRLIQATSPVAAGYSITYQRPGPAFISGAETPVFTIAPGALQTPAARRLELPFSFHYYGKDYRMMWVSADGYITFGSPDNFYRVCNSIAEAVELPTIAPLWMELAYGGPGQRSENVYFSSGQGSVTIRWAAETWFTGEPVNFSVVLHDNGQIVFQYGDGNNNLVNSPYFGCNATTPLIGLSNGRGTLVQTVDEYVNISSLDQAPPVSFEPPYFHSSLPEVRLESPEAGGRYAGILTIRGVAWDPVTPVDRLDVLVDGVPRRLIIPNIPRPDFCATEQVPGCPGIGFQFVLDLNSFGIQPGPHTVRIRATNKRGAWQDFPAQPVAFTVEPGQSRLPVGRIETPEAGATISAVTPVRGWVYGNDVRIVAVDVVVDGATYGQSAYGARRDDVCATLDPRPANCPSVGFTFNLNTLSAALQLSNGRHLLQVRARDESGRVTLIPETPVAINVSNTFSTPPQGVLLNPEPNQKLSGVVKIWGWAWDTDGTVRQVRLVADNSVIQVLTYGDERAAQCATLPNIPACPNIGFWGDFDTRLLTNGLHQIAVQVIDDTGNTVIIPRLSGTGMNVVIDNR